MINVALTLLGIFIGTIATFLVSRHYFRRTVERKLTPFIHLHSQVFAGIDPEVRNEIKIHYRDEVVNDLTHYQVLIANTGDRSIRDFINPLTVIFPERVNILDVAILHRSPKELELGYKVDTNDKGIDRCKFDIPLLNKGDFFLVKFLLKGLVKPYDPEFRLTVDDIPPRLNPEWLSFDATTEEKGKIEWGAIAAGSGFILAAIGSSYFLSLLWKLNPSIFPYPWSTFKFSFIDTAALLFSTLLIVAAGLLGIILVAGIGFEEVFPRRKHKFLLPKELRRSGRFRIPEAAIIEEIEKDMQELKKEQEV
jgi:hypothetical protein